MRKKIFILGLGLLIGTIAEGQQKGDTVIISLGKTSKVIFTMQDRNDLEILKHYNFQELFQDIFTKIEKSDTLYVSSPTPTNDSKSDTIVADTPREEDWSSSRRDDDEKEDNDEDEGDDDDEDWDNTIENRRRRVGRTSQSFNFDLGTNNYLSNGKFPDDNNAPYAVRPWGSWYIAGSSIQRTRVGSNVFFEWGLGISWYNFKFQNDNVMIVKTDDNVQFVLDPREVDHRKSKLTATYLNASFIPVLDFGGYGRKPRMWDGHGSSFRIGIGPYIGYRISSWSKLVYEDNNDDVEKEKDHDNFYLNNFRYGARLQVGFHGTDLFFNYDLNELFAENRGPKLNAFSFGVIF